MQELEVGRELRRIFVWSQRRAFAVFRQQVLEDGGGLHHDDVADVHDRRHAHFMMLLEGEQRAENVALDEVEFVRNAEFFQQPRDTLRPATFDVMNDDAFVLRHGAFSRKLSAQDTTRSAISACSRCGSRPSRSVRTDDVCWPSFGAPPRIAVSLSRNRNGALLTTNDPAPSSSRRETAARVEVRIVEHVLDRRVARTRHAGRHQRLLAFARRCAATSSLRSRRGVRRCASRAARGG